MLDGFTRTRVTTRGAEIAVAHAGSGPPLLLLHGYPQTHAMWHRVAPALAETHTVVCPDLRGYGASSKPPGGDDHAGYAKRTLAQDQVEVMTALGFERFALVGHDRGGRVSHRLALDHPERVERLALLDIVPTHTVFANVDQAVATGTYHWFFLIQPAPLPERLIGNDPEFFLRWHLRSWSAGRDDFFDPEAVAAYVEAFRDPATIHATCEDYRAGASIDLAHDEADLDRRIACPLLVLWGARGKPQDLAAIWRDKATQVEGQALDCGHFLAEERPDEVVAALRRFLA
ncbi:MAG: alpha/beta hydrolase [Thermoleophilia bacterium]